MEATWAVKEEEEKQWQEASANRRLFIMPTLTLTPHLPISAMIPGPLAIPILGRKVGLHWTLLNNNLGDIDASDYAFPTTH